MISTDVALDGEVLFIIFSSVGLTPRRRPSSSSRPSHGHRDKAATAEHPVKAASGTEGEYNAFSLCAFHLCNSRLAGARPPPTHQPSSAVVGCARPSDCGHASSRDHRSRAQPRECRTAAEVRSFLLVWFCLCCAHASLVLCCRRRSEAANRS